MHLVAGGAFARGIEVARRAFFEEAKSKEESEAAGLAALITKYGQFECPPDSAKSLERTCGALEFYYSQYPLGGDGARPISIPGTNRCGIEFSFAEPLEILHPETGNPIIYAGSCDMIAEFAGGVYGFDEKTTSSLGASWAKQWEMRAQFTGYVWGMRQNGIPAQGVIIRGVSILKTKYDTLQCVTGRSDYEVERWHRQTLRDIKRAIAMWEDYQGGDSLDVDAVNLASAFDYNLDHACAEYGGCAFVPVCKSSDPETWLPMYFTPRVWDPISHSEITVEEYEARWFGNRA